MTRRAVTGLSRSELVQLTRHSYAHRARLAEGLTELYGADLPRTWHRTFSRAAVLDASCEVRNWRSGCRIMLAALLIALAASGLCWLVLFLGADRPWMFVAISGLVLVAGALGSVSYVINDAAPAMALLKVSAASTLVGAMLLWLSGSSITFERVASGAEAAASFLVLAASSALGAMLSSAGLVCVRLAMKRRRARVFPESVVIIYGAEVLAMLDGVEPGMRMAMKNRVINWLAYIEPCLRGLSRKLPLPPNSSRQLVEQRFAQASTAVGEYQAWVALEQPQTIKDLRTSILQLVGAAVTGFYHDLPQPTGEIRPARTWIRGVRQVLIGLIPVGALVSLPLLGITLPEPLRQWVTGLALVWLIARLIKLFDRDVSWQDIQEAIRTGGQKGP
ncbi:hypothetical protein [Kibdelosporangium aridum]|uniref:hypothetical protein n=1 Tax=Kibdelosporangium aridum TaxID=2030 RepID=UPI000F778411|nr:hypothetical protein [Kibdelosporangium aridum]